MKSSLIISLLILSINILAQDGFEVRILDKVALPESVALKADSSLDLKFSKPEINSVFNDYTISRFKKFSKLTKHPILKDVYRIETMEIELAYELLNKFPEYYTDIYPWYRPEPTYTPDDFALERTDQNDLDLIRAKDAWEITKGDPDIIVGISDTYIQTDHEDLAADIHSVLNNSTLNHPEAEHGVRVSFCAAGVTDNNTGLSSIGFNTSIMFSTTGYGELLDLAEAGANIVNASWRNCYYTPNHVKSIEAIHDLGVVITSGAGNGTMGTSCPAVTGGHDYCYPASLEHVISVSSVGHWLPYGETHPTWGDAFWADCHEDSIDNLNAVHTHNDSVDICAPGYVVRTASINASGDATYASVWGTSFAAPMVAGVCALMLDENPNLTPEEVENILKSTAFDLYTIRENAEFDGLLGAGRRNADAAVNAARETNVTYASIPYSTGFESGLDENWTMYESHRHGRCVRSSDHSPHSGSYHITMDVIENNNYNTNEAWMHLDLSGESDVELEFWWKETSDETHTTDGVYISDDGGDSFTKIYNLSGGSSTYSKVTIDLSDEISDASLSHSSTFVVKFQQYDNYSMPTDGIAIDDILVCAKLPYPSTIYTPPSYHCIYDWEEYSCSSVAGAVEYDWESPGGSQGPAAIIEDGTRFVDVRGTEEGLYVLRVRAKNECGDYSDWRTTSIWIDDCGRAPLMEDNTFLIYPNPANDYVTVSLNEDYAKESEITEQGFIVYVFNQYGNLVISEETKGDFIRLNIGNLPNGSYVFRILYQGEFYSYEVIVQH